MRKFAILLVTAVALTLGTASAQSFSAQYDTTQYAGGAIGLPITGYYGVSDLLFEGSDLRFRVGFMPFWLSSVTVGADILFPLATLDDAGDFNLYAGGGPSLGFGLGIFGGFYGDLTGVVGVDYRINDQLSVFGEGGVGVAFRSAAGVGGVGVAPRGALGVLFHF